MHVRVSAGARSKVRTIRADLRSWRSRSRLSDVPPELTTVDRTGSLVRSATWFGCTKTGTGQAGSASGARPFGGGGAPGCRTGDSGGAVARLMMAVRPAFCESAKLRSVDFGEPFSAAWLLAWNPFTRLASPAEPVPSALSGAVSGNEEPF